jgi:capsular exopolysaccharide synthesis family protein
MSQIFDALQRAESERAGNGSTKSQLATEVLGRAERMAAEQWEKEGHAEKVDGAASSPRDLSVEVAATLTAAADPDAPIPATPISEDERLKILGSFRAIVPTLPAESRLVCLIQPESPAAEAFRLLGMRLRDLRRKRTLKKILVTSTIPQEGKSMVAANLACVFAQTTHQKVLLLEGDVRRPSQSKLFGFGSHPGLCEWLQGDQSRTPSMYRIDPAGLWILPAGKSTANSLELLQLGKVSSLMDRLASIFDTIIIDSPPVLPLADTSVWMRLTDGILLVARQGKTEKRELKKGLETLDQHKLVGTLLNCSRNTSHNDYYYRRD